MSGAYWNECRFLESSENLKPLVKSRFGREPSTSVAREISACLQQGRLFYEAAAGSPLEIRPLQMFYGMVGFSKALILANHLRSFSAGRQAHGLKDISRGNSRIANLRVQITNAGTFQDFNDVISDLTRVCYIDKSTKRRAIFVPSAKSDKLRGVELSFREILSRVPIVQDLYRMTFREEARTEFITFDDDFRAPGLFTVRIDDAEIFTDRESLRGIVCRWRKRFPFLTAWTLTTADHGWGNSIIIFRNERNSGTAEFSEERLLSQDGTFVLSEQRIPSELFPPEEALTSVASSYPGGGNHTISPIGDACLSEYSIHYLALFLLSSLVRYRPQTWMHAISRSVLPGVPADDQVISLIERFLELNSDAVPAMIVG